MCTSFAVYNSKPIYGMNFDFPDVAMRFRIAPGIQGVVFYLGFEWEGRLHEFAGMNASGLFAAAQILIAHFDITFLPEETSVSPSEIFRTSLQNGRRIGDVLTALGTRRLGYSTVRKGHQIYADPYGGTLVLEPGPNANQVYSFQRPFTILANRTIQRELQLLEKDLIPRRIDRFRTAHQLINAKFNHFSIPDAFEVLNETNLVTGRFTTQSSIVCDPLAGEVYLALQRDFARIWKVCLQEKTIETFAGFRQYRKLQFNEKGISSVALQSLELT